MEIKRPEGMVAEKDLKVAVFSTISENFKGYKVSVNVDYSNTIDVVREIGKNSERRSVCISFKRVVLIDESPTLQKYDFLKHDVDHFLCVAQETALYREIRDQHKAEDYKFKVKGQKNTSYLTTFESQSLSYVHFYEIQVDITGIGKNKAIETTLEAVKQAVS